MQKKILRRALMKNDPAKYLSVIGSIPEDSMRGLLTVLVRVYHWLAARRWLWQVHPGDGLLNSLSKET
ncbi:MAG: hypothetical protein U0694_02910 [Anaerolineae bacterium]